MARGRLEGEERRTNADGQCRLVYQNGIVGAIVALLDPLLVTSSLRESLGLLNPFFHSLSEILFIFLLSLLHSRA